MSQVSLKYCGRIFHLNRACLNLLIWLASVFWGSPISSPQTLALQVDSTTACHSVSTGDLDPGPQVCM